MMTARLLTPPTNYAVVQLPERQFPGVVFQGDSLASLVHELESAISETDPEEQADCFDEILERLRSVKAMYEKTLKAAGISLPY